MAPWGTVSLRGVYTYLTLYTLAGTSAISQMYWADGHTKPDQKEICNEAQTRALCARCVLPSFDHDIGRNGGVFDDPQEEDY